MGVAGYALTCQILLRKFRHGSPTNGDPICPNRSLFQIYLVTVSAVLMALDLGGRFIASVVDAVARTCEDNIHRNSVAE